jgi:hypothetical protein
MGVDDPIRLSTLAAQAHVTERTARTAFAVLSSQGYGWLVEGRRGRSSAREAEFQFNPSHPSRVSVASAEAYLGKRRKARISTKFQNGKNFHHITHESPSETLFEKEANQDLDPPERTARDTRKADLASGEKRREDQEPVELNSTQMALVEALAEASSDIERVSAAVVVANTPVDVTEALAEAGPDYLRSLLEAMPSRIARPEAALLSRLRSGAWRQDLLRGAREWRTAHPEPAEALGQAHAIWTALRATRPPEGAAWRPGHLDQERAALDALLGLAEAQIGASAASLRGRIRRDLLSRGEREGSVVWNRLYRMAWVADLGKATGLDLSF